MDPLVRTQGADAFRNMQASLQDAALSAVAIALSAVVIALTASSQATRTVGQVGVFGGLVVDIATHAGWHPPGLLPLPNSYSHLRDFCSVGCLRETSGRWGWWLSCRKRIRSKKLDRGRLQEKLMHSIEHAATPPQFRATGFPAAPTPGVPTRGPQ